MPALKLGWVRWHLGSDDVPIFAAAGALFHAAWIVVILLTNGDFREMPEHCHEKGRQYIATVAGLLFSFTFGFVLEVLLIWSGCQGAPLEISKRHAMPVLLCIRLGNLCSELVFTGYGTYVVFFTDVTCHSLSNANEVVWNPKREARILVVLTWCFEVITLLSAWLWYNALPKHEDPDTWESRFLWVSRWLLCQGKVSAMEPQRQKSLRRIARWVTRLIGHVDLTPSDVTLALILVATLQRRRRREHIKTCLLAARDSEDDVTAPARSAALLDANDFPTNSHFSGWDKFAAARSASGASSPPPGPTQRPAARAAPRHSTEAAESKLQAAQDTPKASGIATQAAGRAALQPADPASQPAGKAAPHPAEGASQPATGSLAPDPTPHLAPQAACAPSLQAHPRRSTAASAGPRPPNADPARLNPGGLQELLHKRQASLALRSTASRPSREQPRLPGRPQVWGGHAASEAADLAERGWAGPPAALHGGAQAGAPVPEARQAAGQAGAAPVAGARAAQPAQLDSQDSGHAAGQQGSMGRPASAGCHNVEEAGGGSAGPLTRRSSLLGLADSSSMQAIQEDAPLLRPGVSVSPFEAFSHRALAASPSSDSGSSTLQGTSEHSGGGLKSHAISLEGPMGSSGLPTAGSGGQDAQPAPRQRPPRPPSQALASLRSPADSLEVIIGAAFAERGPAQAPATAQAPVQPAEPIAGSEQVTGATDMGSTPLEKYEHKLDVISAGCITPSGMEEDYRGHISPERAVQLYTNHHWHVPGEVLAEAAHWLKFAVSIYGLEPHSHQENRWANAVRTWVRQWRESRSKGKSGLVSKRQKSGSLYEKLNYEAIKQQAAVQDSELIYVSFANRALAHLPYMVTLDPSSRSVVVAIRGTATMEDVVTDSLAEPVLLHNTEWLPKHLRAHQQKTGEAMYAHAGIVAAAAAIFRDMEAHGLLYRLLDGASAGGGPPPAGQSQPAAASLRQAAKAAKGHFVSEELQDHLDCKGWQLVLTGHSLGAGVASLMALRLVDRFPRLKCWAFGPPGGMLSANLSSAMSEFCTSVIIGKDLVARLSVVNIGRLLDELVTALALCKLNKNDVFLRRLGTATRHQRPDHLFWNADEVPEECLEVLERYNAQIESRSALLELVPPGRVAFLRPRKVFSCRHSWDAVWIRPEEVMREGILISPKCLEDHLSVSFEDQYLPPIDPEDSTQQGAGLARATS